MTTMTREEFDAEMAERDRQTNEWRVAMDREDHDIRLRIAEIKKQQRETETLIKQHATSLHQLWREFFGHTDPQTGGHA